jgi:ribosomal protein S18 acetylase RimI-like enzyme
MKIRCIEKRDRPALKTILQTQKHFKPSEIKVALEIMDLALMQPNEGDYLIYVAEGEGGDILGYVCYGKAPLTDAVYDLYWIVVHPVFWHQGTGSFLLRFAEKDLKSRQARVLLIETSSLPPYEAPRLFYLKHQYKELARVRDYYAVGDHKIIFGKILTGEA